MLVITSHASEALLSRARALQCSVLGKPVDAIALQEQIQAMIGRP